MREMKEGAMGVIIKMCHRPTTSWSNGVAKFKVEQSTTQSNLTYNAN